MYITKGCYYFAESAEFKHAASVSQDRSKMAKASVQMPRLESSIQNQCADCTHFPTQVTVFILEVTLENAALDWRLRLQPPVTFEIRRRYRDFDALHCLLTKQYGHSGVPVLPPKQLIKKESLEFLEVQQNSAAQMTHSMKIG